jgi:hypothetical protein
MMGAASFGGTALALSSLAVLFFAIDPPHSLRALDGLLILAATTLGTVVGAAEAPRRATGGGLGALRVVVAASVAALMLFALVVEIEAALGTNRTVDWIAGGHGVFSGSLGASLAVTSVACLPGFLLWGVVGAVVFRSLRRRFEPRAV